MRDVRRDELSAPTGRTGDEAPPSLATAALLLDGVRRRIYRFVRGARRPVTRAEAAYSARVSRNLAGFHLDRLVEAGLLRASEGPPAGRGRVGRRPRVYEAGPVEVHLDLPARQHGLLASVLLEGLATAPDARGVELAAIEAAARRGAELAGAATGADIRAALRELGFEPYESAPSTLRLGTCPFHPLEERSRELVCGLNLGLIGGLLRELRVDGAEAVLAPRPGECCVEVRLGTPAATPPLPAARAVYVLVARLREAGVARFADYERAVLPLLAGHGGRLERRLRSPDGRTEVHLVSFPSPERFAAYRDDPRRAEHANLLQESGAAIELFELRDAHSF